MEIRTEPLPWKHKNLLLLGDEDEKMIRGILTAARCTFSTKTA